MYIRECEEKDIKQITILLNELQNHLNKLKNIFNNNKKKQEEYIRLNFERMKNDEYYKSYVYIENNEIIGFISMIFYRSLLHHNGTALINELIVKHNNRNKGIGEKLLLMAIKEAKKKEMDEIEAGVLKENADAIRFYKRNGFDEEYYLLGMEFK